MVYERLCSNLKSLALQLKISNVQFTTSIEQSKIEDGSLTHTVNGFHFANFRQNVLIIIEAITLQQARYLQLHLKQMIANDEMFDKYNLDLPIAKIISLDDSNKFFDFVADIEIIEEVYMSDIADGEALPDYEIFEISNLKLKYEAKTADIAEDFELNKK